MKKHISKWLCLLLTFCLFFTSCSEEERIFYYHVSSVPQNLDPQVASTPEELSVISGLFDGLFSLDANGTPVLQAAESYEISASGLVYTIHLKQNLFYRFQVTTNSENPPAPIPVTAHDYVFGMQRVFTPETRSPHATTLSAIENSARVLNGADPSVLGIKALDDYTLQITLSYPDASFLEALTCAGAMPCNREFFESTRGAYGLSRENLICNGPYNLRTWNDYDGVTLIAVDENAPVTRIRLPLLSEDTTSLSLLKNKATDACILPYSEHPANLSGYHSTSVNTTTWVLIFNPNSPGLNNRLIRQALGGIAQVAVEDMHLPEGFTVATGLVPPSVHISGTSYREMVGAAIYTPSISSAQSSFSTGLSAESLDKLNNIRILVVENSSTSLVADMVNQNWQKNLSAFFAIDTMPLPDIITAMRRGDFDIALIPVSAFSNDIYALLLPYSESGTYYWIGENNTAFNEALFPLSYTVQNREPLYLQAERALLSDYVICPLMYEDSYFITSDWLKDVYISPFGPLIDFHSFVI
jgi:ABC-type oligopeptide transport system, periplasmic component